MLLWCEGCIIALSGGRSATISFQTSCSLNDKRRGGRTSSNNCPFRKHSHGEHRTSQFTQDQPIPEIIWDRRQGQYWTSQFWNAEQRRMANTESSCNGMSWSPALRDDWSCHLNKTAFTAFIAILWFSAQMFDGYYDSWWLLNSIFKANKEGMYNDNEIKRKK